jgi:hypothetical protein
VGAVGRTERSPCRDTPRPGDDGIRVAELRDASGQVGERLLRGVLGFGCPRAGDQTRCPNDKRLELVQEPRKRRGIARHGVI